MKKLFCIFLLASTQVLAHGLHDLTGEVREQARAEVQNYVNHSPDISYRNKSLLLVSVFNVQTPGIRTPFLLAVVWDKSNTFSYELFLTPSEKSPHKWKVFARGEGVQRDLDLEGFKKLSSANPTVYLMDGKTYKGSCASHFKGF